MKLNAILGPQKKSNVIIVSAKTSDQNFENYLKQKWIGGKKNDVIVLFGVSQYPKIDFVRIISWTKEESLKTELKDELYSVGSIDNIEKIVDIIQKNVYNKFVKRDFKDFEYLKENISISGWGIFFLILINLATIGGYIYYIDQNHLYRRGTFGTGPR